MSDELFAVVTRIMPVRLGGRIIVHAYGPYSKTRAKRIQQQLKTDARTHGYANRSEVSCCRLIDVDRMNHLAELRAGDAE